MISKRVPDRVHVVRPPEQDGFSPSQNNGGHSLEIVRMLAQISDKLKRSEAERYELLGELREYRRALKELEDKADNSEKIYLAIENKLKTKGSVDTEALQRQAKFEKALKLTEEKLVKSIAGQAVLDQRLKQTEDKQTGIDQRLDQSISEQIRLDRQLELTAQDKARVLRKVERLEEMLTDTQDTLRAKAMVLLTDQSSAAQAALKAPAWGTGSPQLAMEEQADQPWWKRSMTMQTAGMASMIIAALLGGWTINQLQQPNIPQIAVLENGGLARLNLDENRWEAVGKAENQPVVEDKPFVPAKVKTESAPDAVESNFKPATMSLGDTPEDVMDYSDDQLIAALNNNPDELASKLNDIEPSSTPVQEPVAQAPAKPAVNMDAPSLTSPMKNFEKLAFVQDPKLAQQIKAEKVNAPLASRMKPDASLPSSVKAIEKKAFAGDGEAQHDLAAIYTAGHGGVNQNFEKAAFWFREASDNGIANARYNLGVLYHQGLGTERDLDRALYWYREAAKLNHAEAQYNLGIAHIEGIGTNYDPRLAAAFFERAANNGIMEAAYNLGLIYENGLLGEAKPDEALYWYKMAADQGSADAKSAMQQLAKNLQIDMNDVNNLVERMKKINSSAKNRAASDDEQTSSVTASSSAVIAQVQEYLMMTGAYSGPADGLTGPKTEKAVRVYQAANNMPVTGRIDAALLNAMVGGSSR